MDLTTLTKFKAWYNFPAQGTDDPLLENLISASSQDILAYLDRKTLVRTTTTDYFNGTGGFQQYLKQWPAISVSSVNVGTQSLSAASPPNNGYFLDPFDGFPPGRMQYVSLTGYCFSQGVRNVNITYDYGYCVEDEAWTIGSSPYQITALQSEGLWAQDDGVTYANGNALTPVLSSPAVGQYVVVNGIYTFNSADTGQGVLISYSYIPNTLSNVCDMLVGEQYRYRQNIGQKSVSVMGNTTISFDNILQTLALDKKLQPFKRMVPC